MYAHVVSADDVFSPLYPHPEFVLLLFSDCKSRSHRSAASVSLIGEWKVDRDRRLSFSVTALHYVNPDGFKPLIFTALVCFAEGKSFVNTL